MSISKPQINTDIFLLQTNPGVEQSSTRDVRQDNSAPGRASIATNRPYRVNNIARQHKTKTKPHRTKNRSSKRQTEPGTAWYPKDTMAGIRQLAQENKWSKSYTIKTLTEIGLAHTLSEKHAVRLEASIEKGYSKARKKDQTTMISLLTRIAYDTAQTKIIAKNILKRQPNMTADNYNRIVDGADKKAKMSITGKSAQLTELVGQVKKQLEEEEKGR